MLPPRKSFCITRPCITPAQAAQDWGAHKRKAGLLSGGGDSKCTRLNDSSDCSTEADRSIYVQWRIFVCQVATFVGVGPGLRTSRLFRHPPPPTLLWIVPLACNARTREGCGEGEVIVRRLVTSDETPLGCGADVNGGRRYSPPRPAVVI